MARLGPGHRGSCLGSASRFSSVQSLSCIRQSGTNGQEARPSRAAPALSQLLLPPVLPRCPGLVTPALACSATAQGPSPVRA